MKAGEGPACSPSLKTAVEIQGGLIGEGRGVDHLRAVLGDEGRICPKH